MLISFPCTDLKYDIYGCTHQDRKDIREPGIFLVFLPFKLALTHSYAKMVDVKASNTKLVNRARRIIRTIGAEVGVPPSYASIFTDNDMLDAVVRRCGGSVKLALVVVISGWGVDMCTAALERRNGVLKATLEDVKYETIVRVFGR